MADPRRVAILISGRGSNMRALVDQARGYEVVLVASNKPQAAGLDWARARGLPTWCWDHRGVEREAFDAALTEALVAHRVGTIALAGYMRLLSPAFVARWNGRIPARKPRPPRLARLPYFEICALTSRPTRSIS